MCQDYQAFKLVSSASSIGRVGYEGASSPHVLNARDRFRLQGLDVATSQRDPLLTPKDLQQDRDPLGRRHSHEDREVPVERTRKDSDLLTRSQLAPRKLDRPVALASSDFFDYGGGDSGGVEPVHHEADHARTPTGGVPLQPNEQEGVTGEKGDLALLPATAPNSPLA